MSLVFNPNIHDCMRVAPHLQNVLQLFDDVTWCHHSWQPDNSADLYDAHRGRRERHTHSGGWKCDVYQRSVALYSARGLFSLNSISRRLPSSVCAVSRNFTPHGVIVLCIWNVLSVSVTIYTVLYTKTLYCRNQWSSNDKCWVVNVSKGHLPNGCWRNLTSCKYFKKFVASSSL